MYIHIYTHTHTFPPISSFPVGAMWCRMSPLFDLPGSHESLGSSARGALAGENASLSCVSVVGKWILGGAEEMSWKNIGSGWLFGTFNFLFFYILGIIIPID